MGRVRQINRRWGIVMFADAPDSNECVPLRGSLETVIKMTITQHLTEARVRTR